MFIKNDQGIKTELGEGVSRNVLSYSDEIMMVEAGFSAGSIGAPHSHPHTQSSYVLCGEFEVTIGDRTEILKAGDTFLVPSDVIHGVVAITDGKLLDVFTPCRKDFVK